MGFLLGLDHASLTKVSPRCSKISDNYHPIVKNLNKLKDSRKLYSKRVTNKQDSNMTDSQVCTLMKEKEATDIQDTTQTECYSERAVDTPNEVDIQQCLRRTLSSINAKSNRNEKLSLVKINKATTQIVSGVKYTVAFDAKDELTGESYSSEATILSQPWSSEEPAVVNFKCTPRAGV